MKNDEDKIDYNCPWNDHGTACGKRGSMSDSTNGSGPWRCSEHHWRLKGQMPTSDTPATSYRRDWYAERKLDYAEPKLTGTEHLRHIAGH